MKRFTPGTIGFVRDRSETDEVVYHLPDAPHTYYLYSTTQQWVIGYTNKNGTRNFFHFYGGYAPDEMRNMLVRMMQQDNGCAALKTPEAAYLTAHLKQLVRVQKLTSMGI